MLQNRDKFENEYFGDIQQQINEVKDLLFEQKTQITDGLSEIGTLFGDKQDLQNTIVQYLD